MLEIIKEEENVKTVKVTLEHEKIEKAKEEVYADLSKNVKIKGFRKGRVPRNLLNTIVGTEKINDMVKETVADVALEALYNEEEFKKMNVMLPPALVSIDLNEKAEVTFEIHLYPEVEVESLEGEEIEIPELREEDVEKDVEEELQRLREENAVLEPKGEDEVVEEGDHVEIEYHVTGKEETPRTFDFVVKDPKSSQLFQDILGKKVGDTIEFVDERDENKTSYTMKITAIHRRVLANLDDDFAKTVDVEAETLEALKQKLREKIKGSFDEFMKTFESNVILDRLANKTKLKMTDHSLDLFVNHVIMRQKENKEYEKSLKDFNGDEEAYKDSLKKEIENYLKVKGAVEKIAEEKGIEVTEEEIFEKAKEYYASMNISDERLKVTLSKDRDLHDRIKNELLHNKVAEELLKNAKITVKKAEEKKEEAKEESKEEKKPEKEEKVEKDEENEESSKEEKTDE
ncbi:trigger factor [Mesoaciditoga lauensis]|uniref:trigger factor n=1 Tax=Mesoaciditoga lauensis TaxID=1495039 RepID=UPI00056D647F|nr:trigger factor [Mesoaciditoga lauensis]